MIDGSTPRFRVCPTASRPRSRLSSKAVFSRPCRRMYTFALATCCLLAASFRSALAAHSGFPTKQSRKFIKGYTTDPSLAVPDYVRSFNKAYDGKGGHKADGAPYETPVSDVMGCCQVCPTRFYKQLSFLELPPEVHAATEANFWAWFNRLENGRARRRPLTAETGTGSPPPPPPREGDNNAFVEVQGLSNRGGVFSPNVFETKAYATAHNNKFERRTSTMPGGSRKSQTKRPDPVFKQTSPMFSKTKTGMYACPQNYGSAAFYGDSVCCNICPDDDSNKYPFRDFSTYVPNIFGADPRIKTPSGKLEDYLKKNRDKGAPNCPWQPEPYVDGFMAPKCCRLCATSFVPFFKKPEFNDDPVANMAVFTPRADNMGHTLPKIYTGLAFLEESLQEDPRRSSEMREGLLLRQTQLRPTTRQVFVDDVDDLATGVAPSTTKNSVRKKKNFAGFARDARLSGYEAVEVFPDHPADDEMFDMLIELETSTGVGGEDTCCVVCPSDVYMSTEGGSLEDKPFGEPTSEQERVDEMLKPLGISPRRVGNSRKYNSMLHPTKYSTFTEGTASREPNFNGYSEHAVGLP